MPEKKKTHLTHRPKISFEEWQNQRRKKNPPLDERMKNSKFWGIRTLYKIGRSVGIIFIAVGSFLAWLIGFLFI